MTDSQKKLIKQFENATCKNVVETIEFQSTGVFTAVGAAERKAKELGYTVGSMCRDEPIGLARNVEYIAKWRNIDPIDRNRVEGGLLSDDFREGDVILAILE